MSTPSRRCRRAGSVLVALCAMLTVAACGSDAESGAAESGAEGTAAESVTTRCRRIGHDRHATGRGRRHDGR